MLGPHLSTRRERAVAMSVVCERTDDGVSIGRAMTAKDVFAENALLRGVICLAIVRLDGIDGSNNQDVESILATIRGELEAALA